MDVLQKKANESQTKPTDLENVEHLFFSKGITPRQFREDYYVPEIISIILTESYNRKRDSENNKKANRR